MLLVDNKQVSANELATMFKVPIEKLKKTSVFQLNPNFKGFDLGMSTSTGKAVFRTPVGRSFNSYFTVRNEEGYDIEIRYAKTRNMRKVGDKMVEVFSPRKVRIDGAEDVTESLDEAIFLWLNPRNEQSPFREEGKLWTYKYQDTAKNANEKLGEMDVLLKAITHATTLSGQELMLFAKGIGLSIAEGSETSEIRAQLGALAQKDPIFYMSKVNNQVTLFEGKVIDAMDQGVFILKPESGIFRWVWGKGHRKGQLVVDIMDKNEDSRKILVDFIKENINTYYQDILNAHKSVTAELNAEQFLKSVEGDAPVEFEVPADYGLEIPQNFTDLSEYLKGEHPQEKSPAPAKVSAMLKLIQSGEITSENIKEEAKNYISKIEEVA